MTPEILEIWLSIFEYVPEREFVEALKKHLTDPDQGKFYPTPAHILDNLVLGEKAIKAIAAQQFDNNPGIDGNPMWNQSRETDFERNMRKREWIQQSVIEWQAMPFQQKLRHSGLITEKQFQAIDQKHTAGVGHENQA